MNDDMKGLMVEWLAGMLGTLTVAILDTPPVWLALYFAGRVDVDPLQVMSGLFVMQLGIMRLANVITGRMGDEQ